MTSLWDSYTITNAYDEMRCPANQRAPPAII